ncbi:hypothetical protein [Salinigranum halophilum]|uniref:hypothetical protein n=1 Tax=Salinigranum halophilum TaxID=2565931 RepID=UPI00191BE45C|nr:hypothetical protein [Salinigranum halophilum]
MESEPCHPSAAAVTDGSAADTAVTRLASLIRGLCIPREGRLPADGFGADSVDAHQ